MRHDMKKEVLEKIREEFYRLKQRYETNNQKQQRLEELSHHPLIQEYLLLQEECQTSDKKNISREQCLDFASEAFFAQRKNIKETNGIFVFLGSTTDVLFMCDKKDIQQEAKRSMERVYCDIEKNLWASITIPLQECATFEKEHHIIYLNGMNTNQAFYELQNEFLLDAVELGQEDAVKKVLEKGERRK